jgi:hypothetical protein
MHATSGLHLGALPVRRQLAAPAERLHLQIFMVTL